MTDSESTITKNFSNQLEIFGITPSTIHRNLPVAKLVDIAIQKNEGMVIMAPAIIQIEEYLKTNVFASFNFTNDALSKA